MANDLRKLRPGELCRLLNSTPLGEVFEERQLYRHHSRAGFRIGDGKTVDLLKYLAWLQRVRHVPADESKEPQGDHGCLTLYGNRGRHRLFAEQLPADIWSLKA